MSYKKSLRLVAWMVLATLAPARSAAVQPVNLARSARAVASDQAPGAGPELVNDGDEDTRWAPASRDASASWIELRWPSPVTFREVLVRQFLESDFTQLQLQARRNGTWETVKTVGDGKEILPKVLLLKVSAQTADALRLTGFIGNPSFYEIEVYAGPTPPVIEIASDAAGHIIGIATDAWGAAPLSHVLVSFAGRARDRPWRAVATTDEHGMFSVAAPTGLAGEVQVHAHVGSEEIGKAFDAGDLVLALTPPDASRPVLNLNGMWKFAPGPPAEFYRPDFDDSGWKPISVPSHWLLQGFISRDGVGGYRHHVQVPAEWKGRRIKIRFDGVYSGAEVWFNGRRAGSHEGGFTPFDVDVTDSARTGDNLLAVRVWEHTRSSQLDSMSLYADFPLTGIMRKVTLFAVPDAHVEMLHVATLFDPAYRNATLRINLKLVNESGRPFRKGELRWRFQPPEGTPTVAEIPSLRFSLPAWGELEKTIEVPVQSPLHWDAEHPRLYRLTAHIAEGSRETEQVVQKIGFRQTDVRGTELLINGVPVKLRGTCHHDSDPVLGRAVTPELTLRDLQMIKEANLDAVRTSHYPPVPELTDDADELGVYVEEEAPNCWVGRSYDLRLAPLVVQHAAEMLERDRNHASVIWWSLGNESTWGPIFDRSHDYVKQSDPTRPTSIAATHDLELATHHNPSTIARIHEYINLKKPLIFDESLAILQGIYGDWGEMWRDPGYRDYWVVPLIDVWNEMLKGNVVQGSFIWCWADDIFQVPNHASEHARGYTRLHDVDRLYHVPGKGVVGDAPWGVVDGWRRKKPEFWNTKKLHSPIKVTEFALPQPRAGEPIRVPIENRFDFTNLSEFALEWQLGEEKGALHPDIAPHQRGEAAIPIQNVPTPGGRLSVRFVNGAGEMVDAYDIRIGDEPKLEPTKTHSGTLEISQENLLAGTTLRAVGDDFELGFDKDSGMIRRALARGQTVLYESPKLHVLPIDVTLPEFPHAETWKPARPLEIARDGEDIVATATGRYRDAEGKIVYRIKPTGVLDVSYDFTYTGPQVNVREIGLRFGVPPWCDTLEWKRRGEWSVYPEDHIGRNAGKARAHSELGMAVPPSNAWALDDSPMGTNDFRSTKRHILWAALTSQEGYGISINSNGDQHLRASVESERIAVHLSDWYGGTGGGGDWNANYGKGRVLKTGERLQCTAHLVLISPGSGAP